MQVSLGKEKSFDTFTLTAFLTWTKEKYNANHRIPCYQKWLGFMAYQPLWVT